MSKTIEVLLTQDVLKLGDMGDIVSVKAGFARNYLLPEGKAIPASRAAKRQVEVLREQARKNDLEREGRAAVLKNQLEGKVIEIPAKVAHDDYLFGSVGVRDIIRKLATQDIVVDPRQVHLHEVFKRLGRYEVLIKLHHTVECTIVVVVSNADPQGEELDKTLAAAGEAQADAE